MKKLFIFSLMMTVSLKLIAGSGDVDGDGKRTLKDVEFISQHIMGNTPKKFDLKAADVNDDTYINATDIVILLNMILNKDIIPWEHPVNTGLPVVFINTPGGKDIPTKKESWMEKVSIQVYNPDGTIDYKDDSLSIRQRGNLTATLPKKPYALKLNKSSKLLGMNKHKRWCLLANWIDRTLLRNDVAFQIARQTALDWTPTGKFVEVMLNGKHVGNYYLCEQIRVNKNRVNITEMKKEDITEKTITGGYLLEIDVAYDEVNKFTSAQKSLPYMIKSPDEDVLQPAQKKYITDYINKMEELLYADNWLKKRDYADMMDIGSFVDNWFVQELAMNSESRYPKSTYMFKDRGGKLKAGPVWDFDYETFYPSKTAKFNASFNYKNKEHVYYERLLQDPQFVAEVKTRWNAYKEGFDQIPAYIREMAAYIKASNELDIVKWPLLPEYGIPATVNGDQDMTFDEAVERMISCYEAKLAWMNEQIKKM